jgi:hypothetical protein
MMMFEISPKQAGAIQPVLDRGDMPNPFVLGDSTLDIPRVFCWRCLRPFEPRIARTKCRGTERYASGQAAADSAPGTPAP